MADERYVHGYSGRESARLIDQATTLGEILHHDTVFPRSGLVLEAGCGVGAQSELIAGRNPDARIVSFDVSFPSVQLSKQRLEDSGIRNVSLHVADLRHLPFRPGSFDHVFVCFVLEHLPDPVETLVTLKSMLKPGGGVTVIEGDHGSTLFHPRSREADQAIECLVSLQARSGGNALIGRELFPLLRRAAFRQIHVSPRVVYVDAGHPELVEGFTRNTFIAMVESIRNEAIAAGLLDAERFDRGIEDLRRTTAQDGTFFYSFFKATGIK